jgi:hypothetical protein
MHFAVALFAAYAFWRYLASIEYNHARCCRSDLRVFSWCLLFADSRRVVIVAALIGLALGESIYALWQRCRRMLCCAGSWYTIMGAVAAPTLLTI